MGIFRGSRDRAAEVQQVRADSTEEAMSLRFKTVAQFSKESGYSEDAIRGKIRDGVWLEGRVWKRAPDGHILIDVEGDRKSVV